MKPTCSNSGWGGIRTHERLSPLPVFKVGEALPGAVSTNTQENTAGTLLRPSGTVRRAGSPRGETEPHRDMTSQIETTLATSQ